MDFVTRLKKYMEYVAMPVTQFADTAGIARPTLSQILSGRNKKVSNELIAKLHAAFPDLNVLWLLFGDGDMISDTNIQTSSRENTPNQQDLGLFSTNNEEDSGSAVPSQRAADSPQTTRGASSADLGGAFSAGFVPSTPLRAFQTMGAQDSAGDLQPDSPKRVQSIMVFYSDNSYELFTPAQR